MMVDSFFWRDPEEIDARQEENQYVPKGLIVAPTNSGKRRGGG